MKVPGRAWLQYEVMAIDGGSRLVQTAFFEPKGLPGLVYWYVLYPVHGLIFRGTVRAIAERADVRVEHRQKALPTRSSSNSGAGSRRGPPR